MRNVKRPPRRVLPENAAAEPTAESPRPGGEVYRSELGAEARQPGGSIDFGSFPPGHAFGRDARVRGITIEALAPSDELAVVETRGGATALRIPRSGVRVCLPSATSYVALTGWLEGRPAGDGRDRGGEVPERAPLDPSPPSRWEVAGRAITDVTLVVEGGLLGEVAWRSDAVASGPDR